MFIVLIVFCFVMLFVSYSQKRFRKQLNEVKELPYKGVALETMEDGIYTGKAETSFLNLELSFQIKDKSYAKIEIVESTGSRGQSIQGFIDELVSTGKVTVPSKKGPMLEYLVFLSCLDQAQKE